MKDQKQAIKDTLEKLVSIYAEHYNEKVIEEEIYQDFRTTYPSLLPENIDEGYILAQMNVWCQGLRYTGVCFMIGLIAKGYMKDHYGMDVTLKYLYDGCRFCHCVISIDNEDKTTYYDVLNPEGYSSKDEILFGSFCHFSDRPPVGDGYWAGDVTIMQQFICPMQKDLYAETDSSEAISSVFMYNFE